MDCKDRTIEHILSPAFYDDICTLSRNEMEYTRFQNKTVLITGAAGLIGKYLVLSLLCANDLFDCHISVIALVHSKSKAYNIFGDAVNREDIHIIEADVCHLPSDLPKADFIVHAASPASAIQYRENPVGTFTTNTVGTYSILEYARLNHCESIVCCSSLKIYGQFSDKQQLLSEESNGILDFTNYLNCYAEGKRATEMLCNSYFSQFNLPVKLVRPSYIYGACSLDDDRVWAQFIANVVRNENILLKSNGAVLRSFCYVRDTASAIFRVLLDGENGAVYNIADKKSDVTIRQFAKIAVEAFPERNLTLSFENESDSIDPAPNSVPAEVLTNDKIIKLGWKPQMDVSAGVKKTVSILEQGFLKQ